MNTSWLRALIVSFVAALSASGLAQRPGDPYWNAQTLSDVALRYPGIDLSPYGAETAAPAARPGA